MSKKKVEKSDSVVVDVDNDVTSVSTTTTSVVDGEQPCVDVSVDKSTKRKQQTKSKKVVDIALETQIADMEKALENAKNAIESAAADNERMADELGVAVAENKSLRKELSKCKQDYKKCQGDNRANSALIETLDGELTRSKSQNAEFRESIVRLQEKNKSYADELALRDASIAEWEFEVAIRDAELKFYKTMNLWQRIKFVFLGTKMYKQRNQVVKK